MFGFTFYFLFFNNQSKGEQKLKLMLRFFRATDGECKPLYLSMSQQTY